MLLELPLHVGWESCHSRPIINLGGRNMCANDDSRNNQQVVIQADVYNGHEPTRVCPKCGREKPLSKFGYRNMGDGTIRNQSWCKDCR